MVSANLRQVPALVVAVTDVQRYVQVFDAVDQEPQGEPTLID